MEILFAIVIGAAIGLVIRLIVPRRHEHGLMLLPMIAAAVTAVVWAALVWAGFTFDGGWIWWISLVLGGAASLATAIVLPTLRRNADERLFERLRRA